MTEVARVLGRHRGIRIGEPPDRDGQYFPYLAMWLFALNVLAERRPRVPSASHRIGPPDPSPLRPAPASASSGRCART